ncbi:hypothetical protein SAMN05444410_10853 [Hydrobacter penzbergensis]|uniref:Uncharacterized protein n=1 Tax=Hydrobacter penzbergensis TaxID=1235997 RepID=A0A8X8IGD7_9BACT|nr:hypothetical protein [Hydrobacter penzbergensis]SDX02033.1 hypothetical protein SAMN05444410_10853 [Hydrobacter penzbergensis]
MQIKLFSKANLVAVAALMMATVTMSFKLSGPMRGNLPTDYHYKIASTVIGDLRNIDNWEVGTGNDCGTGTDVPCVIPYTASPSEPTFQDFLNNRTLDQLKAAASSQKMS